VNSQRKFVGSLGKFLPRPRNKLAARFDTIDSVRTNSGQKAAAVVTWPDEEYGRISSPALGFRTSAPIRHARWAGVAARLRCQRVPPLARKWRRKGLKRLIQRPEQGGQKGGSARRE